MNIKRKLLVRIYINRNIFKNNILMGGDFAVLFHYPNQVLSSLHTVKRQWTVWNNNKTNHWISFNIKSMEVHTLRYKVQKENCISDWQRYDNITLKNHLKSVGCKTPDQIIDSDLPTCSTRQKMKQARIPLNNNALRPCKRVESVDFDLGEAIKWDSTGSVGDNANSANWFSVVLRILNNRFKETIQHKEVDIQTLIGYIGGYIGILTGFSLIQIPNIAMTLYKQIRKWMEP